MFIVIMDGVWREKKVPAIETTEIRIAAIAQLWVSGMQIEACYKRGWCG